MCFRYYVLLMTSTKNASVAFNAAEWLAAVIVL